MDIDPSLQPQKVFRHCPRCGSGEFKPDSVKSMKCSDCQFQWFFNMSAAVAAMIFDEQDRLLFTIRKHDPEAGMLDLPGGFVDFGETLEEALHREIKEELNLEINQYSYLGSFPNQYVYGGITYHTIDVVYECVVRSLENIVPSDDVADYVFINPDDVDQENIGLVSIKRIIEYYRESIGKQFPRVSRYHNPEA